MTMPGRAATGGKTQDIRTFGSVRKMFRPRYKEPLVVIDSVTSIIDGEKEGKARRWQQNLMDHFKYQDKSPEGKKSKRASKCPLFGNAFDFAC